MRKRTILSMLTLLLALTMTACGNVPVKEESSLPQSLPSQVEAPAPIEEASQPDVRISAEEQKLLGVWEADDGALIAIRERTNRERDDFAFDAIFLEPVSGEWLKITRDETTFDASGEAYILSDLYNCPDPSDPTGNFVETEERLEYDAEKDTLLHINRHPTEQGVMEWSNTFHRTDRSPTDGEIDWDWYYEIHPNRK